MKIVCQGLVFLFGSILAMEYDSLALKNACMQHELVQLQKILTHVAVHGDKFQRYEQYLCGCEDDEAVSLLIDAAQQLGASKLNYILYLAVMNENYPLVKKALAANADPNTTNYMSFSEPVLFKAMPYWDVKDRAKRYAIATLLLEAGANPNKKGYDNTAEL